jgi:hypothetical protein
MKRIVFILPLILLLVSCSNTYKAKKAVRENIRSILKDSIIYEPGKFGELEIAYSTWEDSPSATRYLAEMEKWLNLSREAKQKANLYRDSSSKEQYNFNEMLSTKAFDSAKICKDKIEQLKSDYKPVINGWKIEHFFKLKTPDGNFGSGHIEFYLDMSCNKITRTVDLSAL